MNRFAGLLMYEQARAWGSKSGLRGQIALYLHHSDIGAAELRSADASPLAIAWAREHHLPVDQQSIDPNLAAALKAADD